MDLRQGWGGGYICKILVVKAEGKRSVGEPRHKYKNNIKINLKARYNKTN